MYLLRSANHKLPGITGQNFLTNHEAGLSGPYDGHCKLTYPPAHRKNPKRKGSGA